MKVLRVPLSCPLVFLLLLTPAEGNYQVIGSHEPIVAVQGDDVILPCHVEPRVSMVRYTVEWSRPDLKPDPNDRLSRVEYVHLYRDSREVPDMKISSYVKRTALFTEGLIHGNISLKIINVTLEDRGRYKCFIPKLKGSTEQFSIVHLVVEPVSTNTSTTETPLQPRDLPTPKHTGGFSSPCIVMIVVSCILVIGVVIGVIICRLSAKNKSQGYLQSRCLTQVQIGSCCEQR
ncbi:Myelin-oligodendrocyte glycoprotein Precursor [Larimichthys crocea]|uniref:Myelin-oligodendrocyte glycoprotein n=1 Tax=Larimichthys crocea TaxID=215358 RepID=A0A6G0HJX9_LARCR|nr:Myelin-oligodendrocyte glycoprotein Precursor [Larimichthys crocea]